MDTAPTLPGSQAKATPVPVDYAGFARELRGALESRRVNRATALLLKAKSEWFDGPDPAGGEPVVDRNAEIVKLVLSSDLAPAVAVGLSPRLRRGGKGVSPLARRVSRAASDLYAERLKYPWRNVSPDESELVKWVRDVVAEARRDAERKRPVEPEAENASTKKKSANRRAPLPASLIQQIAVVLMNDPDDVRLAGALYALAEASVGISENVLPAIKWSASQLAKGTARPDSLRAFVTLTAVARASARAADQKAAEAEARYQRAAADVRHYTTRTQELSRDLQKAVDEKASLQGVAAGAVQERDDAKSALEGLKQQSQDLIRIEQEKIKADIARTLGHEITEATLSLDTKEPSIDMALDRLKNAQRKLAELTRND